MHILLKKRIDFATPVAGGAKVYGNSVESIVRRIKTQKKKKSKFYRVVLNGFPHQSSPVVSRDSVVKMADTPAPASTKFPSARIALKSVSTTIEETKELLMMQLVFGNNDSAVIEEPKIPVVTNSIYPCDTSLTIWVPSWENPFVSIRGN